ncbi:type II secretion system protein GspE, partial [Xylella fastidiosa subsp. multiplex]|nr:type II secretion system protein GspE [Xylella fastidiosa subsp. multiplex]
FTVDDEARRLIHEGSDERELRRAASAAGMFSMREDGARWVGAATMS